MPKPHAKSTTSSTILRPERDAASESAVRAALQPFAQRGCATARQMLFCGMTTTTNPPSSARTFALPNLLTYGRIVAVPVVVGCMYWQAILGYGLWLRWLAFAIFVIAGITDVLDGYVARMWAHDPAAADRSPTWSRHADAGGRRRSGLRCGRIISAADPGLLRDLLTASACLKHAKSNFPAARWVPDLGGPAIDLPVTTLPAWSCSGSRRS